MNNTQTKQKTQRRNKAWLRSPDQRKHKKMFTVNMIQLKDGSFHLVGGGSQVALGINQHAYKKVPIDVRDLATEMRLRGVYSF